MEQQEAIFREKDIFGASTFLRYPSCRCLSCSVKQFKLLQKKPFNMPFRMKQYNLHPAKTCGFTINHQISCYKLRFPYREAFGIPGYFSQPSVHLGFGQLNPCFRGFHSFADVILPFRTCFDFSASDGLFEACLQFHKALFTYREQNFSYSTQWGCVEKTNS